MDIPQTPWTPASSSLPASICSPIPLCFRMRLGSGDSVPLSTLVVQPATVQHRPLSSPVWGLISDSRQESCKEQLVWFRTLNQMLRAGTRRVKLSLPPACPLQCWPQLLGIPGVL